MAQNSVPILILAGFRELQDLDRFFRGKNLEKGRLLFQAGHVYDVRELLDSHGSEVTGRCIPQTKINAPARCVKLSIGDNRQIVAGSCDCRAGVAGKCKHAAAVALYVQDGKCDSKTSHPRTWGVPTSRKSYPRFSNVALPKKEKRCQDRSYELASATSLCRLKMYLTCQLGRRLTVVFGLMKVFLELLRQKYGEAQRILTCRNNLYEHAETIVTEVPYTGYQVQYGLLKEPSARKAFEKKRNVNVAQFGLVVCPGEPWLACSPDGIFRDEDSSAVLLEIKCPFSRRQQSLTKRPLLKYLCGQDILDLRRSHSYFTQVQVCLHVLGLEYCYFYIHTEVDSLTIKVRRDDAFLSSAVPKLRNFYFEHFLRALHECADI
ncbi:uncharacterized protein LOC142570610 [Dermacentor variabilis]|uniref:uncharacterized protein LOC142570610 n=1 Tax=Dermacentor variabilis TaxID=34621 RepID=UPI003F5CA3C3